jgi:hypothetical protein
MDFNREKNVGAQYSAFSIQKTKKTSNHFMTLLTTEAESSVPYLSVESVIILSPGSGSVILISLSKI